LIAIGLLALLTTATTANAQAVHFYTLVDLGVLPGKKANMSVPAAINDKGQVAGTSGATFVDESAFLYDPQRGRDALVDLGKSAGGISRAFGINAIGDVVGDSTFGSAEEISHAALFSHTLDGKVTDLGTLSPKDFSRANGINASEQVVGVSGPKRDDPAARAFFWSLATGMFDIGTLGGAYAQAFAINDASFVTGTSQIVGGSLTGTTHAFIYQPLSLAARPGNQMMDLGTLGGDDSYGMAINANNHIAGYSNIDTSDARVHAFVYDGAKMRDLGSLGGKGAESDQSVALGLNGMDQVVGWTYLPIIQVIGGGPLFPPPQAAFIYTGGGMVDLNTLLETAVAQEYWLYSATAINNEGQIVATALERKTNEVHAVLLMP
jgi:probable HAF family extracellular repeat protein